MSDVCVRVSLEKWWVFIFAEDVEGGKVIKISLVMGVAKWCKEDDLGLDYGC